MLVRPAAALLFIVLGSCGPGVHSKPELGAASEALSAGAPTLVADITGPVTAGSIIQRGPRSLTDVNGTLFFVGTDPGHGAELWKTDGTSAGTVLVKDIFPGPTGSSPTQLVNANGTLFFTADDGSHGIELWKSDGTEAGTALVKDIYPGPNDFAVPSAPGYSAAAPTWLTAVGSSVFFAMEDGVHGYELWTSDGTPGGTFLVKDIAAGATSSPPSNLANVNGTLFFRAGTALWKTDGTAAGTALVSTAAFAPLQLIGVAGRVYFMSYGSGWELWTSDGTSAGTVRLRSGGNGVSNGCAGGVLTNFNGKVVYPNGDALSLYDPSTGLSTDLTSVCGSSYSGAAVPTVVGNTLYFAGGSGAVFKSDGTVAGTVLVKSFFSPLSCTNPATFGVLNGTLYLNTTTTHVGALWKSDGTSAGTVQVTSVPNLGDSPCYVSTELVASNGKLFFAAGPPGTPYFISQHELWASDGTAAGTVQVSQFNSNDHSSRPASLTDLNGTLLFSATSGSSGNELWKSDGTTDGTSLVADLSTAATGSQPANLVKFNDLIYFDAGGTSQRGLYKSDGTTAGTSLVAQLTTLPGAGSVSGTAVLNDKLFFFVDGQLPASSSYGWMLWSSDGSFAGTAEVQELPSAAPSTPLVGVNGHVVFVTRDNVHVGNPGAVWTSDGTRAGTVKLLDASAKPLLGWTNSLAQLGNSAYFLATATGGPGLWKTDGTQAGTSLVTAMAAGPASNFPAAAAVSNGKLFLVGYDATNGYELWTSDGTAAGTALLKDLNPGSGGSNPVALTDLGGTLYFAATDGAHGYELWKSDGTAAGTVQVADIFPGGQGGLTAAAQLFPVAAQGVLFFAASDGSTGMEPWTSDGTAAGTVRLGDLHPGPDGSSPAGFALSNGRVFFQADDGTTGSELWSVSLQAPAPPLTVSCPADVTAEATSSAGAPASYPPATSSGGSGTVSLAYSTASGAAFALGATTVTAIATDAAGGSASCRFTITVRDTTPPTITCPADVVAEATSTNGASVTYPAATVSDAVSTPTVSDSQASGSAFVLGTTTVTATARDAAGNESSCSFRVTVKDTTAPVVTCPANLTVEATSSVGAVVNWPAPPVSDAVTGAPSLIATPASGSRFPPGSTAVTITATDAANNASTCTFQVTVVDTTPPVVTCPMNVMAEATSAAGAVVTLPAAEASDAVSLVQLSDAPASGSGFPLGVTTVTVTATDAAMNRATCTFTVAVVDSTPPLLRCPAPVTAEATGPEGAVVDYPAASATDAVSAPTLTYSQPSTSAFPLGVTLVTVTAADAAMNTATCTFPVTVADTTPPTLAPLADLRAEATSASGAVVHYPAATATDLVSAVTVDFAPPDGSQLPLGTTEVQVTATDATGNAAQAAFRVEVVDTTPPVIQCPADVTAQATASDGGAVVSYPAPTATDAVTARPEITEDHASGQSYPVGRTTVTASARDAAGNGSTCRFIITVTAPAPAPMVRAGCGGCSSSSPGSAAIWVLLLLVGRRVKRPAE